MGAEFRHELKHEINAADRIAIRQRLQAVARSDPHAVDGKYLIRSLYFDDLKDTALREKTDGLDNREKFRMRYYNHDTGLIHLEKKCKLHGLCRKDSVCVTADEAQAIVDGSVDWMKDCGRPLLQELYAKMRNRGLKPKTIVDYIREPFIFDPGNVRVTIDYDIRTGLNSTDFLNPDCMMIPTPDSPIILEVKWDEFLPDIIRDAVGLKGRREGAFSKYAACRMYD
jgi:hypothetical protein